MLPTSGLYTDVNETSVLSRCSTVPYGALRCRTVLHFYIGYVAICTAAPYGTAYGTVRRRTVRCRIAPHGAVQCYSFTPDTLLNVLQCTAAPRSTVRRRIVPYGAVQHCMRRTHIFTPYTAPHSRYIKGTFIGILSMMVIPNAITYDTS